MRENIEVDDAGRSSFHKGLMNLPEESDKARQLRFAAYINQQGHPFQQRVVKTAEELFQSGMSAWAFEVAEFPVEVGGAGTRIDFILRTFNTDHLLLGECKRVNPAFAEWCFLKSPFVARNYEDRYVAEHVSNVMVTIQSSGIVVRYPDASEMFHLGFEIKTKAPGDSGGPSGKNAIEEAASQVCRGMNGMVEFLSRHQKSLGVSGRRTLLPVIFTTAKLFGGHIPTGDIDLTTGTLDPSKLHLKEMSFLYFQYHLSPGIKHGHRSMYPEGETLSRIVEPEYIRTIPIVTAGGVEQFLRSFVPDRFQASPVIL